MEKEHRNLLRRAVEQARKLLEREVSEQLEGVYGILPDGRVLDAAPGDPIVRERLREAVNHAVASYLFSIWGSVYLGFFYVGGSVAVAGTIVARWTRGFRTRKKPAGSSFQARRGYEAGPRASPTAALLCAYKRASGPF